MMNIINKSYGIAIDIGTSGIRAQAIDLKTLEVISTAITLRHPLPGANVMDHLHFAIEVGKELAHLLVVDAINKLIHQLDIDLKKVDRIAVSGNPTQLSIFQNIEIADLAYWGVHALKHREITPPTRDATIIPAGKLNLDVNPEAEVIIPPAVRHQVGADALAMLFKAGIIKRKGIYLVTDFGTNAEIALSIDGEVYTCSAAAGPAIEGQRIEKGMLASPGAICDINIVNGLWKNYVLDENLIAREGDAVDVTTGKVFKQGEMHGKAIGITGTGVIATICLGLKSGLIEPPKIKTADGRIYLNENIYFTRKDLIEAGKALGAFRAAHLSLAEETGISLEEISATYMAGASGFYVDAYKSLEVGQIPACIKEIIQVGNTSLAMAKDLVLNPELLDYLQNLAKDIRGKHIMLAESKVFEQVYMLELAYWEEGMPLWMYNKWLTNYGYQPLPRKTSSPTVKKLFSRDIPVLGKKGLKVIRNIGLSLVGEFEGCRGCGICVASCPEKAIYIKKTDEKPVLIVKTELCNGMACLRCQISCPNKVFKFKNLLQELK